MTTDATPTSVVESQGFDGLGIAPKILGILTSNHFLSPTPIQKQAIPVALAGQDVIGIAQTGTGKTLAFSVPMLQRLAELNGRGMIILPTRELALQVEETLIQIGRSLGLRTAMLIGGASMSRQHMLLRNKPHVIIGTPGRIIDHLEQKTLSLAEVKVLVLDEADRMLDMGFWPQISRILKNIPKERQTMLFSATMPKEVVGLAMSEMKSPLRIEVSPAGKTADRVVQEIFVCRREEKNRLLEHVLAETTGPILIFSKTKFGARRLARSVQEMGYRAADIHSDRSLKQRRDALDGFKAGKYRVLVATDIAARGIDVTGITLVINFDIPENVEDYVHRIGRTARNGAEGKAVSFVTPDQGHLVRDIERLVRVSIPIKPMPTTLPPARASERAPMREFPDQRSGFRGRDRGFGGQGGGMDRNSRGNAQRRSGFRDSAPRGPRRPGGSSKPAGGYYFGSSAA